MTNNLLEVQNLSIEFSNGKKTNRVVSNINFFIKNGETLGVVGESGCGKSVTSLAIMGLIPSPSGKIPEGKILFKDQNLVELSEKKLRAIRGKDISMIFQDPMSSLDPAFTIGYQLDEILKLHTNMSDEQVRAKSIHLLQSVGIPSAEERYRQYPHELSGGMRQRVVIAIALACSPNLLIADEPTTALDVTVQAQIMDLMKELKENMQTSIMLITHDIGVVAEMCDRVVVMYAGQIVEEASVVELFDTSAHPYTIGLLESVPKIGDDKSNLFSIPGNVPSPEEMPAGCRFHPRCQFATDKCISEEPGVEKINESHSVKCWHYKQVMNEKSGENIGTFA
ncbi:ABC transporter ATP-binding protein [Bacillus marinisedimentorum]|uniref:ABC transporter ATP-binding protein n=1 Tax=Bacillus marinisedimentorum TaxID=1821260 RepID=UPI0007DEC152|nr:ABC transporter ATP-binding protein [Bacillus marinisedimentorum]